MSTLSRATGKALMKSLSIFNLVKDMVSRAVDKTKPSLVKSLGKNRANMDSAFVELSYCYDSYKSDTISNEQISDEDFNGEEDGVVKYQHNDKWFEKM